MKINLTNPPKYIKCLKTFYGFNEGEIFKYDNESKNADYISAYYRLDPPTRASGSLVHIELLEAIQDGFFEEYTQTEEQRFESELNDAANKLKNEIPDGTGGGERVKIGFREGVKWYQERIKNK